MAEPDVELAAGSMASSAAVAKLKLASDRRWRAYRWGRLRVWIVTTFLALGCAILEGSGTDLGLPKDRGPGTGIPCALVPRLLTGGFQDNQPDLLSSMSYKVRGRGCIAWGRIVRSVGDVMWIPDQPADDWGARRFLIHPDVNTALSFCRLGIRRTGVTITASGGDELRLVVRSRDQGAVAALLNQLSD